MSKALFLTRIQATIDGSAHPWCVQVFKGENAKNYSHDDLWEIIFAGQRAECELFTINAHHAITPDMATATTITNPKRIIEL